MGRNLEEEARARRHFDGPGWRWGLARALAGGAPASPAAAADGHVRDAAGYLRLRAGGPDHEGQAARAFPDVAAAEQLNGDGAACGEPSL